MNDPSLVFNDDAKRAGTHVLLIGIGDYPWLEDGIAFVAADHEENAMGMGQLSAPPISMRAMANWFLSEFDNPDRPLASLSLLLSEAEDSHYAHPRATGGTDALPRGTIDDVRAAVAAWIKRASLRRDNALVFGFCGHGLQSGNPVLLCRDYGKDPLGRFQGAIDFEQFRIALSTMLPDTQLVFVDACRTPDPDDSQLGAATPGNPLIDMQSLSKRDNSPALQSVHFATSLYTPAWGRPDSPSLFTGAVLKALGGGAAEHTADWWVTTGRLQTVLSTYLQRISASEGVIQRPAAQSQDFRICKPGPITVDLYVSSRDPAIWQEQVNIKARRGSFEKAFVHTPPAKPDPGFIGCTLDLVNPTQGFADVVYDVHALFEAGSKFGDCDEKIIAYPPEVVCLLPVSKRT
jgi:Caspase domain